MIKSILLKNFRSYRNEKISFHKGITLIKGEGLSGKSNIRRGIELINDYAFSKNNKAKFASNQEMIIEVETENNDLKLIYDNDVYFYVNSQKFKRKKTPEELKRILAINEINIQGQLEHPFIVENNSSQLSKTINRITGIDKVDKFIKEINSRLKNNKFFRNKEELELKDLEDQKSKFKLLPKIKDSLRKAKKLRKEIELKQLIRSNIIDILFKINERDLRIGRLEATAKAEIEVKVSEKIRSIIKSKENRLDEIKYIISEIKESNFNNKKLIKNHKQLLREYASKLKEVKTCPYCLSDINEEKADRIKRILKNEVNSVK